MMEKTFWFNLSLILLCFSPSSVFSIQFDDSVLHLYVMNIFQLWLIKHDTYLDRTVYDMNLKTISKEENTKSHMLIF